MRAVVIASALFAVLLSIAGRSFATHDPYRFPATSCHKIKDPVQKVDLVGFGWGIFEDPPIVLSDGCVAMKTKAALLCIPVEGVIPDGNISYDTGDTHVGGQDPQTVMHPAAESPQVCYKVKCPSVDPTTFDVKDPVATRGVKAYQTKLVCLPAEIPPVTTTTTMP